MLISTLYLALWNILWNQRCMKNLEISLFNEQIFRQINFTWKLWKTLKESRWFMRQKFRESNVLTRKVSNRPNRELISRDFFSERLWPCACVHIYVRIHNFYFSTPCSSNVSWNWSTASVHTVEFTKFLYHGFLKNFRTTSLVKSFTVKLISRNNSQVIQKFRKLHTVSVTL